MMVHIIKVYEKGSRNICLSFTLGCGEHKNYFSSSISYLFIEI